MKKRCLFRIVLVLVSIIICSLFGCSTPPTAFSTSTATSPQNLQPIDVISVSGPMQPINPGGPIVEIVLKNGGNEPVVSLTATLEAGRSFQFIFDVSTNNPLQPGKTTS